MKEILRLPVVIAAYTINLVYGNACLLVYFSGWHERTALSAIFIPAFSLSAAVLLYCGFRLISEKSHWLKPVLLGAFVTLIVPLAGSSIGGAIFGAQSGGFRDIIPGALHIGLLGFSEGAFYGIPLIGVNSAAYAWYRNWLRRDTPTLKDGPGRDPRQERNRERNKAKTGRTIPDTAPKGRAAD